MAYGVGEQKSIMSIFTLKEAQIFKSRSAVRSFVFSLIVISGQQEYLRLYVPAMERVCSMKRVQEAEASPRREGDEAYGRHCRERPQAIASNHSNLTNLVEELTRIHGSSGGTGPKRRRFARLATEAVARSLNIASHNLKESKEPQQSDDDDLQVC